MDTLPDRRSMAQSFIDNIPTAAEILERNSGINPPVGDKLIGTPSVTAEEITNTPTENASGTDKVPSIGFFIIAGVFAVTLLWILKRRK